MAPVAHPASAEVARRSDQKGTQKSRTILCRLRRVMQLLTPIAEASRVSFEPFCATFSRALALQEVHQLFAHFSPMKNSLRCGLLLLLLSAFAACVHEERAANVYRGGQYYGDALHAKDLPTSGRD